MQLKVTQNSGLEAFSSEKQVFVASEKPVLLELWNGKQSDSVETIQLAYTEVKGNIASVEAQLMDGSLVKITDEYSEENTGLCIKRNLKVLRSGTGKGIRLGFDLDLFPKEAPNFEELRFFAPPAVFDKNDLDEDGFNDYFSTQKLIYREDRFNYPTFMAYYPKKKLAVKLERSPLPRFDSIPVRGKSNENSEPDALFIQKTDIGSMGCWGEKGSEKSAGNGNTKGTKLCTRYPFYEGDATVGLYIMKTVPFGAFWPMKEGESFTVSYILSCEEQENFNIACWNTFSGIIRDKKPLPAPLPASPKELVRLRLESLNRYYVEKTAEEDPNEPAGYVLNCHPQEGEQLENIIQYGFTGQNILNAYNVLRYGYEYNNEEYIRRAIKVTDFFADRVYIPKSGMFYNLYNVNAKKVDFWWTGLYLPLAYAEGKELENLMGPLYEYRREVIDKLFELEGAYLRCMNEDAMSMLRVYQLEKSRKKEHSNWLKALEGYGEFLLRTQEEDGSWRRAYDVSGNAIKEPAFWFGITTYEKKSSTGTSIPLLVGMYELTGDKRFLESAVKAGRFVKKNLIDKVRFNGGVQDSLYNKVQLIDHESILYPMFGMLALYDATKDEEFLQGAITAAHFNASFVCLWNVPLPEDSTLAKYGFNSVGIGACDNCGAGYTHPFQLMCVAEIARIAILAKDEELLEASRLYWHGCNQTVATQEKDWGIAWPGLQEEGFLVSWWAVDDPMFATDTGFGNRLKGEGNKTCFPWINAVGVYAYWALLDAFNTTDFDEIKKKYMA